MADLALIAVGSVVAIGALMLVCAVWCDLMVWAIDAACDTWHRWR